MANLIFDLMDLNYGMNSMKDSITWLPGTIQHHSGYVISLPGTIQPHTSYDQWLPGTTYHHWSTVQYYSDYDMRLLSKA